MNNKPTIINDVDVSECEFFGDYGQECCSEDTGMGSCNEHPNCLYKQLQRAKIEIEFWKHNFEEMKKCFKNMDETATQAIKEKWKLTEELTALQQKHESCEKAYQEAIKENKELKIKLFT